jgi:hypothetical protein
MGINLKLRVMDRFELVFTISSLAREVYTFWLYRNTIILDRYILEKRESERKKKWIPELIYSRLSGRDSNIKENQVPFGSFVRELAKDKYISEITNTVTVKTWGEYKV